VHMGPEQEIYTVLDGEAIFLMQKTNGDVVENVYAVHAKKGESAIIPSSYGHVTINPAESDLKTSDWSSEKTRSDYGLFKKLQGACYYYVKNGEAKWIKNNNYKNVPELRFEEPLKSLPEDLSFLK
jgi:glucose-6-phosphate isomerase